MDGKQIFAELSKTFPEEAIERTDGDKTGKRYDTAGIKAQYVSDRFNEVLGVDGWHMDYTVEKTWEGSTRGGKPKYMALVAVTISIDVGDKTTTRKAHSEHVSFTDGYGGAIKGAVTNAFKKAASYFGVGGEAWRGELDDDHPVRQPERQPERQQERQPEPRQKDPWSVVRDTWPKEKQNEFMDFLKKKDPSMAKKEARSKVSDKYVEEAIKAFESKAAPKAEAGGDPFGDLFGE